MSCEIEVSRSIKRIAQILGFLLALDENHKMNRLKLIKILWAADRLHIRKYGKTITDLDDYYAMPHGPVCSLALDIAQMNNDQIALNKVDIDYLNEYFTADSIETSMQKSPGEDMLSENNKKVLTEAWAKFKDKDHFELADRISHEYPEWAKYKNYFSNGNYRGHLPIDQEDFFKNPAHDEYFAENEEELEAAHELYQENQQAEQALRQIFG